MRLTQESFAELVGVKRSLIGAYEENRALPPVENLSKIASIFSITVDELLHKHFDRMESNPVDDLPIFMPRKDPVRLTEGIPYVSINAISEYLGTDGDAEYKKRLPKISLPFIENNNAFTAFDGPFDFPIKDAVIIAERLIDFKLIENGIHYLIFLQNGNYLYRRVYNQLHFKGNILCSSDLSHIKSEEFANTEIKQILKPISYISRAMPSPTIDLEALKKKIEELKTWTAQF